MTAVPYSVLFVETPADVSTRRIVPSTLLLLYSTLGVVTSSYFAAVHTNCGCADTWHKSVGNLKIRSFPLPRAVMLMWHIQVFCTSIFDLP